MFMSIDELNKINVGRKELAAILDYHENHINYLVTKEGAPKNEEHNSYSLVGFIKWWKKYFERTKEEEIQRVKNAKPQDQLALNSSRLKELQIKEKEGELVSAADVNDAWQNEMAVLNAKVDGLPIKAAPQLVGISDQTKIKDILTELINDLKADIAKTKLHTKSKLPGTAQ